MRSNTFNYSLLAIGVAAVLGMGTTANAAETALTTTGVDITNQASASYNVSGQKQPVVLSNAVKVTISQQVRFSLTADNDDTATAPGATQGDDKNERAEVAPNGYVLFKHTLKNTGNLTDTYIITLGATDGKYDQDKSSITFTVYEADGKTTVAGRTNITVDYTEGQSLPSTLKKGQSVKFTINAKTLGNKGNETLPLTLTVKSDFLSAPSSNAPTDTLTNNNTSFTRLPTFAIVKTITNGLDLNDPTDTATYKVVVTNQSTDFGTDATEVDIADFLPAGLVLAEPITNITASSTATVGDIAAGTTDDSGFNITGNTIPVGQSITIVFTVKKGGLGTLDPATAINHVTVTDDLDNDIDTDNTLVDSTDTDKEKLVADFYPTRDTNYTDGVERTLATGDDSTGPLSKGGTIQRALTLTGPTFREIAPTSGTLGQVTHTTVITNKGKDIEGSKAGELTFTITDDDGGARDAINVEPGSVTVTYDADGAGTGATGSPIPIGFTTVDGVNVYDINSVLPGGIAPNVGTVTINYKVSSVDAPLYSPTNSTTPTFENTIVTLIPKLEGAPVQATVTDKTTVRGLRLLKTQAIDADCTGTPAPGEFVSDDIEDALPGQCIVYKVQAQNTSSSTTTSPTGSGFEITNVIISDELIKFSANADYVDNSAVTTVSGGSATNNGTAITTTIDTLAPGATETMQFKVKIKTDRVISQP